MSSIEDGHPSERKTARVIRLHGRFKSRRSFVAHYDGCPVATRCCPFSLGQDRQDLVKPPGLVDFNGLAECSRPTSARRVEGLKNYGYIVHLWH